MSVHYKFKSALEYSTVAFDGLHISVGELKAAISHQKRIGKSSDFDLQITNAQTKEVYTDDNALIPKNTSLLVARVPLSKKVKKSWHGDDASADKHQDVAHSQGLADLSRMEGTETDKINAMISQSTLDYDPSTYQKIKGQNQRGEVPIHYRCHKCLKAGHWIKNCPNATAAGVEPVEIRRSTGIPRSFMVPVDGPKAPGAMMTPTGSFAVPVVDHEAYQVSESNAAGGVVDPQPQSDRQEIPDDLICGLCRDLLTDAVMIPCCGNSFCDECIRGALLESEDHECPDCREKDISPTTLIPNRFLRNSVSSFRNQTGYSRRAPHRPSAVPPPRPAPEHQPIVATQLPPPNGQTAPPRSGGDAVPGAGAGVVVGAGGEESDGSYEDNITVTVPPPSGVYTHRPPHHSHRSRHPRYGPPQSAKAGMEIPIAPITRVRDEQRASTPTVDERREPQMMYNRSIPYAQGPPLGPAPGPPPHFTGGYPPRGAPPFGEVFPREPYQPPPPGIKESPTLRPGEDPLEAFNRMIREKEERAKRRETERRRLHSPSPRSPVPRSPPPRARSRTPRSRTRSPPPLRVRTPPSRASSRVRYSRSRSLSRGRVRRSPPWSPRRRRTRDRTLSLTRSPSPRRRRSPLRYRSPLRSPVRSPPRSPLPRSPHRAILRTPPRSITPPPHRYGGGYDDRHSPHRRNVEPPYGSRYGPRSNGPPPVYPPIGPKLIPTIGEIKDPSPMYRARYEEPPFEDIPPGAEPPVPGYEPPPFDRPPLGPPVDRMPPVTMRDAPFHRGPYQDVPQPYRDMPPVQREQPMPPYRDDYRGPPMQQPYREPPGAALPFRDGQPYRDPTIPPQQYRDPNFRGGPPGFRDNGQYNRPNATGPPYRDGGPPHGFRDNSNYRDQTGTFRPPDVRNAVPGPLLYQDPNHREGFRDGLQPLMANQPGGRDQIRGGYRSGPRNTRGGSRRNFEHDRHRDRDGRPDREYRDRYNDREVNDKVRDGDKKNYDRSRDERPRDHDRGRDADKERERDKDRERDRGEYDKNTPEKKRKMSSERTSPKRIKSVETREKRRSESRGHSKDRDKREKKEEKIRDKSADRKGKDKEQKEKERKVKERKKKKKDKDTEKKKKRDKKEKKEKDESKDEDEEVEKENREMLIIKEELEPELTDEARSSPLSTLQPKEVIDEKQKLAEPKDDLYGDVDTAVIDKQIMENYIKMESDQTVKKEIEEPDNEETQKRDSFDGLELQATADDLDLKPEDNVKEKEMLAPLPELSKWEVDDEQNQGDRSKEPGEITSPEAEKNDKKVTSEVLKRAENAIFAKAINSLKPIEIKKISNDRAKLYSDTERKDTPMNNIQITVPVAMEHRSIEMTDRKKKRSKTPQKLSVKERLGGKIDNLPRIRDERVVHSTVEIIKSRSKTPKRDHPYRRVTVDTRDRPQRLPGKAEEVHDLRRFDMPKREERRVTSEGQRIETNRRSDRPDDRPVKKDEKHHSASRDKVKKKEHKAKHKSKDDKIEAPKLDSKGESLQSEKNGSKERVVPERDRKRSTLDEANFEPDYDEHLEADETKEENRKRERSKTPVKDTGEFSSPSKKAKTDEQLVDKKAESGSDTSSDMDSSSSSSSSDRKKKKKKKKKSKRKKKKRAASDSDSDSDGSSSDEPKKKKRKHKKKSSKKKKKSKHK